MRSHKKLALGFLIVLSVAMVSAMAALRGQTSNRSSSQNSSAYKEEPTQIQEGVMTEKQKQHSKLFTHNGPKLRDVAARQKGDIQISEDAGYIIRLPESTRKQPALQSAICKADAVVIGVLVSKSSQLTEEGNFVFTDHEMTIEEIIKNNTAAPLQNNNTITVTRDGGTVKLNGKIIRANREDFKSTVIGKRYLFFLRFIPATGSYLAYGNGSFQLDGSNITALSEDAHRELLSNGTKDVPTFLGDIHIAAANGCQQK